MVKNQRREFLKKGLAGICGAAVVPGMLNARSAPAALPRPTAAQGAIPSLPSRPLGRTGLATPLISMGTAEAPTVEFIRQGYDAGIKFFFSGRTSSPGQRIAVACPRPWQTSFQFSAKINDLE